MREVNRETLLEKIRELELCKAWNTISINGEFNLEVYKMLLAMMEAERVVPEECPSELISFCEQVIDSRITANAKAAELWNACRAAMLDRK